MQIEDDFTADEIELANRITQMADALEDMQDTAEQGTDLVKIAAISQTQLDQVLKNIADAKVLIKVTTGRLEKMVSRRRRKA